MKQLIIRRVLDHPDHPSGYVIEYSNFSNKYYPGFVFLTFRAAWKHAHRYKSFFK